MQTYNHSVTKLYKLGYFIHELDAYDRILIELEWILRGSDWKEYNFEFENWLVYIYG